MLEAQLYPTDIISLVVDGGSSFFLPHFCDLPKCTSRKSLLEIAPYLAINNGTKSAKMYYHFTDYSQDPNFVISVLFVELKQLFVSNNSQKQTLYLQVLYYYLLLFFNILN
jgi:hypothetical protein